MRAIVEALAAAANLALLVRDETTCKEMRQCAERTLAKLSKATDQIIAMKEAKSGHNDTWTKAV